MWTPFLLQAACTGKDSKSPATDDTASDTAADTADTGSGIDCPLGSHVDGDHCAATLDGWSDGPSLGSARDHHVTFVAMAGDAPALFALAGTTSSGWANDTVERSWINADGSLGAWDHLDNLPEGRVGAGLGETDGGFLVVGGLLDSGNSSSSSWLIHVLTDGSITVEDGPELLTSRYHAAVVTAEGFAYAIGGLEQDSGAGYQAVLDTVERATFDGASAGPWEVVSTLPQTTTHTGALVHDGAIYIVGGANASAARTDILRAQVNTDGSLGEWTSAGALPEARATSAVFEFLDQLYVIGGMTTIMGGEVATVLRADFQADGTVGAFEELPELPLARAHSHQVPHYGASLYSVGGSIMHEPQRETFVGQLE